MNSILPILLLLWHGIYANAQEVPIVDYNIDANGRAQLTVASTEEHYYVLHVRHHVAAPFNQATMIVKGKNGSTVLTEPLAAYPKELYKVTEHKLTDPADTDKDGINDLLEWENQPAQSPLNTAPTIDFKDGVVMIPDQQTFKKLSARSQSPNAGELEVKFYIRYRDSASPKLYFVNSQTHLLHTQFAAAIGYYNDGTLMTGSIIFHPTVKAPNGTLGIYRFVFQPNNIFELRYVQKAMELLAANLPFLKNNFCYYPLPQFGLPLYFHEKEKYDSSRVCVLLENDLFKAVDYLAMHAANGFGLLRRMADGEEPGSRDVVLYESLPNDLPRVGGIMTTVMQTPLSHVNLRAIQDNIPNAFIRNALQITDSLNLIGKYVYYEVTPQAFFLREASKKEVDAFYEKKRPTQGQIPTRDLTRTEILPLDSLGFQSSASFGVKCANLATMRRLGFPTGTVPDGFGVPFYFYDEFMKFNGFYDKIRAMMSEGDFQSDYTVQIQRLEQIRAEIKKAPMPPWMMDALGNMQKSFQPGVSIRCRSSTNNEDLPGFSGAGLYDSKTQHPDEGHIAKSVKQVYASMWNFRAFDERAFYRIDHFKAAMAVLVHANHENEQANGVGVSTDPLYQTKGTFYLNTQIGDDLVTNPNAFSVPEEILLNAFSTPDAEYFVINASNLVPKDSLVMKTEYLKQMRVCLNTIHDRFKTLYRAEQKPDFAMEIEYKINANGQLVIKQARPWASYQLQDEFTAENIEIFGLKTYPNPFRDVLHLKCECDNEVNLSVFNLLGQKLMEERVDFRRDYRQISLAHLDAGVYFIRGLDHLGQPYISSAVYKIR